MLIEEGTCVFMVLIQFMYFGLSSWCMCVGGCCVPVWVYAHACMC